MTHSRVTQSSDLMSDSLSDSLSDPGVGDSIGARMRGTCNVHKIDSREYGKISCFTIMIVGYLLRNVEDTKSTSWNENGRRGHTANHTDFCGAHTIYDLPTRIVA